MSRRVSNYEMIPFHEALKMVLEYSTVIEPKRIHLGQALGLVLAEDVIATEPIPSFRASVVDGYAVHSQDGPGEYRVMVKINTGTKSSQSLMDRMVAHISTGAVVPDDADAVIKVEDTLLISGGTGAEAPVVYIEGSTYPGQNIRSIGSDVACQDIVLTRGALVGPSEMALLSSIGVSQVLVHPRPTVAVMSTGDELVEFDTQVLDEGKVRDCNRPMLMAALHQINCPSIDLGIVSDFQSEHVKSIDKALDEADILITSGGVSMGERDLIKPLLTNKYGKIHFGRVCIKPGKPLTFATVPWKGFTRLVFGLPGNPLSSIVTYHLFALPSIRKMSGYADPLHPIVKVQINCPLKQDPERPEFRRAHVKWASANERLVAATSIDNQPSSRLLNEFPTNALVFITQGQGVIPAGSILDAHIIGPL